MKLQDRVAIVTGAAQGIGKAVADKLAAEGASVVAVDLNGEGAERTAAGFDGSAVQADISKPDDVQRIVDEALSRHGKVDVLANVAAIVPFTPWDEITFDEWRRIMSVNLDGLFLMMKAVEKPMREAGYGRIVNVTSNVILAGTPNLGQYGITVNSVAPGLTEPEGVMARPHAEAFEFVQMLQCIPRRGEAADIAPSVAFLASEEAGWVTGQLLVADAGMTHN